MAAGVVFLPSYYEAIKDLENTDRLRMYDAIVVYGLYGETLDLPANLKGMFTLVKPLIDSSQNRYRAAKQNGSKGGRPRKNQTENQTNNQNQNQDKDINTDIDLDIDSDCETDTPTLEAVKLYCQDNRININTERFFNYYAARGWKINGEPVSDWKALIRSWKPDQNKRQFVTAAEYTPPSNSVSYEELLARIDMI